MKTFEREKMIYEDGRKQERVSFISKKLKRNFSVQEIADMLEEEPEAIQRICDVAAAFAPDYDAEQIMEKLNSEKGSM